MSFHVLALSPGEGYDAARWRAVLESGIDGLMIREKQMEARALLDLARRCREEAPHLELWVAGRLDVALAAGCGLHAPEAYPDVPPGMVPLSRPLHDPAQFVSRSGCAQLLVGPLFEVPGKGPAWGAERFKAFLDGLPDAHPRMLALGGLTPETLPALRHPRLGGVALLRALWNAPDPAALVERLRAAGNV